jgi:hypothetical protein
MMDLEWEYVQKALDSLKPCLDLLPKEVRRAVLLAQSVAALGGSASAAELAVEFGPRWVIARRTARIVEKYGEGVRCLTPAEHERGVRRAIERRVPSETEVVQ